MLPGHGETARQKQHAGAEWYGDGDGEGRGRGGEGEGEGKGRNGENGWTLREGDGEGVRGSLRECEGQDE